MIDKYGKSINCASIYLTQKCNLRCMYCNSLDNNLHKSDTNNILGLSDYKFIISGLSQVGINKIKFTGGEPLLYNGLAELIRYAYEECDIDDISISTNGIGLYDMVYELQESGLKTVNISLDSLKEFMYKSVTNGGDLKEVLKSINRCLDLGIKVNINCVVINGFNENEMKDFILMTKFYPIDIRFIELMPLGKAGYMYENGYFNIQNKINTMNDIHKINIDENSGVKYYICKDGIGRIQIKNLVNNSICNQCNGIRITPNGTVKLCLYSKEEYDIKPYFNKPLIFREALKEIIIEKLKKNCLEKNHIQ